MKKVVVANDHGAIIKAQRVIEHLEKKGFSVTYLGQATEESIDYPDVAYKACTEFNNKEYEFGVLLCGTGIGISISANKIKGIRCALLSDKFSAEMAKKHNNANFIAFAGRVETKDSIEEMLDAFIDNEPEEGRHKNRILKMMDLENL